MIRDTIKEKPDITLNELIESLGLSVTESGLSKHMKKLKLTYKKNSPCEGTTAQRRRRGEKSVAREPAKLRRRETQIS